MVKGVSRQVIVVHSPDKRLFDQAIFILHENAANYEVTDEMLLKEAQRAMDLRPGRKLRNCAPVWAIAGALATGIAWLITVLA